MKAILFLFLLISTSLLGQKNLETPYQHKMDSVAIADLSESIEDLGLHKSSILSYSPIDWVKFSISSGYNAKMYNFERSLSGQADTWGVEDYMNIMAYDIRMKIYLNKRLRLLSRLQATGLYTSKYTYTTGLVIKF